MLSHSMFRVLTHALITFSLLIATAPPISTSTSLFEVQPIDYKVFKAHMKIIRPIKDSYHIILHGDKPICCVDKSRIEKLIRDIRSPDTHPITRIMMMRALYRIPINPVRHVINWNEKQYRSMKRRFDFKHLKGLEDYEIRKVITLHEVAEAVGIERMNAAKETVGEWFGGFLAFLLTSQIPDSLDEKICEHLRANYLPNCRRGFNLGYIIYTMLFEEVGDQIDVFTGRVRCLQLLRRGVSSSHVDPDVLIKESNNVCKCQTMAAKAFCAKLRKSTGEYQALRAAGLLYGEEIRDPNDTNLRKRIARECSVGATLIRNFFKSTM